MSYIYDATFWTTFFQGYYTDAEKVDTTEKILGDYCENGGITDLNLFILTPVNTWSNYSFIFFGSLQIALALFSYQNSDEFTSSKMSNQVKKNPAWLIYHGILLIWGGLGSFAMHASYTDMGHLVDIITVVFMLSFPSCYAVQNLFLEDMNRYGFDLDLGDTIGYVTAPIFFLLNILLGFWVEAKDSSTRFESTMPGLRGNVMWCSTAIYLSCLFLKWGKEIALGR